MRQTVVGIMMFSYGSNRLIIYYDTGFVCSFGSEIAFMTVLAQIISWIIWILLLRGRLYFMPLLRMFISTSLKEIVVRLETHG